jgi:hypothetical protein
MANQTELLSGIQRVEYAIGTPISDPTWRSGLFRAVAQLRAAFSAHVDDTEGPDGHYAGLLEHAPRLARGVNDLVVEHRDVLAAFNALENTMEQVSPDRVRRQATHVLTKVGRHRQRGADLIYEAYVVDIGGET